MKSSGGGEEEETPTFRRMKTRNTETKHYNAGWEKSADCLLWFRAGVSKLSSKRARFEKLKMPLGQWSLQTFFLNNKK